MAMNCRMCGGETISTWNFGSTPLANEYVKEPVEQKFYPLEVVRCSQCELVQLKETVNPHVLFDKYLYVSSTSPVFVKHFQDYAESIVYRFNPDFVIDIGSNDGILLKQFAYLGVNILGIEPSNIAQTANDDGIPTIQSFLNPLLAKSLPKAKIVTANNVFAHTENIGEFIESVKLLLAEDGFFIFEVQYLDDLLKKGLFDNIYHEHVFYYHLKPLVKFFKEHGLPIFDVEHVDVHGGSIRVYAGKEGQTPRLEQMLEAEDYTEATFRDFWHKICLRRIEVQNKLEEAEGDVVCGYGAPAKATTFLSFMDVELDFIVDDSSLKQGLLMPGSHTQIYPTEQLHKSHKCLILAWNFADSIKAKHTDYKGEWI